MSRNPIKRGKNTGHYLDLCQGRHLNTGMAQYAGIDRTQHIFFVYITLHYITLHYVTYIHTHTSDVPDIARKGCDCCYRALAPLLEGECGQCHGRCPSKMELH